MTTLAEPTADIIKQEATPCDDKPTADMKRRATSHRNRNQNQKRKRLNVSPAAPAREFIVDSGACFATFGALPSPQSRGVLRQYNSKHTHKQCLVYCSTPNLYNESVPRHDYVGWKPSPLTGSFDRRAESSI